MSVATYDNPVTMAREFWQDGRLIYSYAAELFFIKPIPVPPDRFLFGASIGEWKPGQLVGDRAAIDLHIN